MILDKASGALQRKAAAMAFQSFGTLPRRKHAVPKSFSRFNHAAAYSGGSTEPESRQVRRRRQRTWADRQPVLKSRRS